MQVLSVRNPYSYLICHGIKEIEYRSRPTKHRGEILIHSSGYSMEGLDIDYVEDIGLDIYKEYKKLAKMYDNLTDNEYDSKIRLDMMKAKDENIILAYRLMVLLMLENEYIESMKSKVFYVSQAIIGSVKIVDCIKSKIYEDDYEWILSDAKFFPDPILNIKGKLGFWQYEGDIPESKSFYDCI